MADSLRTEIPTPTKRKLADYFHDTRLAAGKVRCVVKGDILDFDEDSTWHHLNHRPNDHRLSNIVPLLLSLNKNLFHSQRDCKRLNGNLECRELRSKAENAFWVDGQVARAYGCTRIEYYVARYCNRSFSYRLDCARRSLYYARHKLNYEIIDELLTSTVLRPLGRGDPAICPDVIRDLLQELESLLTLGGETRDALRLREFSESRVAPPRHRPKQAGALRRSAHTLGMLHGPSKEVLSQLAESGKIISSFDANQILNVANTKIDLFMGENTREAYKRALDVASQAYEEFVAPKIDIHDGKIWSKLKPETLPIRATSANIADICLMRALSLAVNRASNASRLLPEAILVAKFYWDLAGAKLEAPGRGTWKQVIDSLDNADPQHRELAAMIESWKAARLPERLKAKILRTASKLAEKLRPRTGRKLF